MTITARNKNDITSARWQHLYSRHFGFVFIQWKEVETRHPSLYTVIGQQVL